MSLANPLALQSFSYAQLESSMRTGDIILYKASPSVDKRVLWAQRLARLTALLPCSTCVLIPSIPRSDDETQTDERSWLQWSDAAVVVQMTDETETNPSQDANKLIPYVFVAEDTEFRLQPLKALLASVAAAHRTERIYCAVRQFWIDSDGRKRTFRLGNQLRCSLREQIIDFYREILITARAEAASVPEAILHARDAALRIALDDAQPPPARMLTEAQRRFAAPSQHYVALFRVSSCYFTLYTLYRINLLRVEPQAALATTAIQENGCVERQLFQGYQLGEEVTFYFNAPLQPAS